MVKNKMFKIVSSTKITREFFPEDKRLFGRRSDISVTWRQAQEYSVACERNKLNKMLFFNVCKMNVILQYIVK